MARKKTDPILEEGNLFEEYTEMEKVQADTEAVSDSAVEDTAEIDANGVTDGEAAAVRADNEVLVLDEAGGAEWGAASDDSASAESGETPPSPEKTETEFDSFLSEVSELGLNDSNTTAPLTLPESDALPDIMDEAPDHNGGAQIEADARAEVQKPARTRRGTRKPVQEVRRNERILTIDAHDEVMSEAEMEATRWHEVQNAHLTRKIVTGTLDSVERTKTGGTTAVASYNGYRVAIPLKEMMLYSGRMPTGQEYEELMVQLNRNLNARLGSEIDFVIRGIDNKSRAIAASRKDAMLRKRQTFYMDTNEFGEPMIYEGRVVQARVVAVAEKIMRVEVFGVECAIRAPGMSWMWIGNARDYYNVGDRVLVRVLRISKPSVEDLKVEVDIRSVSSESSADNLNKCVVQGRYAGRVTDVRGGVVFIRLNNGVNAVAHSCYDARTPGKKDDVSFAVTRLDAEQGVAHGLITRIIRQNI